MTLIVEDGTGLPTANSYASEQEFRDYCALRGYDITAETQTTIEARLIRSTEFIDLEYKFLGERTNLLQALQFPRTINDLEIGLPLAVKNATNSLAFDIPAIGTIYDIDLSVIESKKEKVATIETDIKYVTGKTTTTITAQYPMTAKYLDPYLDNNILSGEQYRVISG